MSQENVEAERRRVDGWTWRRASVIGAALVAIACVLFAAVPAGAVAGRFQQLAVLKGDEQLWGDGTRFRVHRPRK